MHVEITPEPSEEERHAILAALENEEADGEKPSPWRRAGLGPEDEDQTAWLPRQRRGAARA
jgi:hypothetical protein